MHRTRSNFLQLQIWTAYMYLQYVVEDIGGFTLDFLPKINEGG